MLRNAISNANDAIVLQDLNCTLEKHCNHAARTNVHEAITELSKNELIKKTTHYHGFRRKGSITIIFSPAWSIALHFRAEK